MALVPGRVLAEDAITHWEQVIGSKPGGHEDVCRATEVTVDAYPLNRLRKLEHPINVRIA